MGADELTAITLVSVTATCAISVVSGFTAGLSGFGSAIFFQLIWLFASFFTDEVGSLTTSLSILWFISVSIAVPLTYTAVKEKTAVWPISVALVPGAAGLTFLGSWLLVNLPLDVLTSALGLVFLAFSIYQISSALYAKIKARGREHAQLNESQLQAGDEKTKESRSGRVEEEEMKPEPVNAPSDVESRTVAVEDKKSGDGAKGTTATATATAPPMVVTRPMALGAFAAGCFSGVLGGAFGTGGPPIMIYFSKINMSKSQIRGTVQPMGIMLTPFRLVSLIIFGIIQLEEWPLYVCAPVFVQLGLHVGKKLHSKFDDDGIKLVLQMFIIIASVSLVNPQLPEWHGILFVCIYIGAAVMFCIAAKETYHAWKRKQVREEEMTLEIKGNGGALVQEGLASAASTTPPSDHSVDSICVPLMRAPGRDEELALAPDIEAFAVAV